MYVKEIQMVVECFIVCELAAARLPLLMWHEHAGDGDGDGQHGPAGN